MIVVMPWTILALDLLGSGAIVVGAFGFAYAARENYVPHAVLGGLSIMSGLFIIAAAFALLVTQAVR